MAVLERSRTSISLFEAAARGETLIGGLTLVRIVPHNLVTALTTVRAQTDHFELETPPSEAPVRVKSHWQDHKQLAMDNGCKFLLTDVGDLALMNGETEHATLVRISFHPVTDRVGPFVTHAGLRIIYDAPAGEATWGVMPLSDGTEIALGAQSFYVDIIALEHTEDKLGSVNERNLAFIERIENYKRTLSSRSGSGEFGTGQEAHIIDIDLSLLTQDPDLRLLHPNDMPRAGAPPSSFASGASSFGTRSYSAPAGPYPSFGATDAQESSEDGPRRFETAALTATLVGLASRSSTPASPAPSHSGEHHDEPRMPDGGQATAQQENTPGAQQAPEPNATGEQPRGDAGPRGGPSFVAQEETEETVEAPEANEAEPERAETAEYAETEAIETERAEAAEYAEVNEIEAAEIEIERVETAESAEVTEIETERAETAEYAEAEQIELNEIDVERAEAAEYAETEIPEAPEYAEAAEIEINEIDVERPETAEYAEVNEIEAAESGSAESAEAEGSIEAKGPESEPAGAAEGGTEASSSEGSGGEQDNSETPEHETGAEGSVEVEAPEPESGEDIHRTGEISPDELEHQIEETRRTVEENNVEISEEPAGDEHDESPFIGGGHRTEIFRRDMFHNKFHRPFYISEEHAEHAAAGTHAAAHLAVAGWRRNGVSRNQHVTGRYETLQTTHVDPVALAAVAILAAGRKPSVKTLQALPAEARKQLKKAPSHFQAMVGKFGLLPGSLQRMKTRAGKIWPAFSKPEKDAAQKATASAVEKLGAYASQNIRLKPNTGHAFDPPKLHHPEPAASSAPALTEDL